MVVVVVVAAAVAVVAVFIGDLSCLEREGPMPVAEWTAQGRRLRLFTVPGATAIPHSSAATASRGRTAFKEYIADKGIKKGPAIKKPP